MKLFPGRCQEFRVTRARFESLDWVKSAGLLRALLLGTAIGKGVKETPCTNSLRLNIANEESRIVSKCFVHIFGIIERRSFQFQTRNGNPVNFLKKWLGNISVGCSGVVKHLRQSDLECPGTAL